MKESVVDGRQCTKGCGARAELYHVGMEAHVENEYKCIRICCMRTMRNDQEESYLRADGQRVGWRVSKIVVGGSEICKYVMNTRDIRC